MATCLRKSPPRARPLTLGILRIASTSVTLPGSGGTVSFKYDPFGRRIYKSSPSATSVFAYDGDNLAEETNSSGAAVARYEPTQNIDEPLAMLRSGATSYFQADGLGSITSLSNAAGAVAQTYQYDSFGQANRDQWFADESIPVHGARVGRRNRLILLSRQILRSERGKIYS